MKHSFFLSLALGAGWLLSPESLVIAGNGAGRMGWLTIPLLASIALLYTVCAKLINSPQLPDQVDKKHFMLQSMTGIIPATSLRIAAVIPLVILGATALLVTSGYTFNEVFLYWFPNFGFSFLLLALLTILQLFPEKYIFKAQICFVSLAAGGLLILALYGITTTELVVTQVFKQPSSFSSSAFASMFLLFAWSTFSSEKQQPSVLVPVAGLILFSCWILVSLSYVDAERLASSTIPYMTAARRIMGEPGRQIMGIIVISGTCAAITGLLLVCRRMLWSVAGTTSHDSSSGKALRWFFPPLIAIITGSLMATGLAGDEQLEVLLRGALILWLIYYDLLCLAAVLQTQKATQTIPIAGATCTVILLAAVFILISSNTHRMEMLRFLLSMFAISGLLSTIWFFINKDRNQYP
ncbi:MAG: hypothetical protein JKY62_01310 [Desulfocapsa sp.]|nr:hypothetical protein [Desulfocapsa sp.]MBN4048610.1 hypothetical protein [bacterium AH-315-N22]